MRIDEAGSHHVVIVSPSTAPAARTFRDHLAATLEHRCTPSEARAQLSDAWAKVVGEKPSPETSALLTAHWALETDTGRAMPGHNFAGIKAAPASAGAVFRTVEGYGATRREVNARFRVYESAQAGARDYVNLLHSRYPEALSAARAGDSHGFARALADGGYFTADPRAYSAGLQQRLAALDGGHLAPSAPRAPETLRQVALNGVLHALQRPAEDT